METNRASEDLRLIREMIERTKKATAESWSYLFIWGVLAILGVLGMYGLVWTEQYHLIWVNWIVFVGIGVIYTLFFAAKEERVRGRKTYTQIAVIHLCVACGVAFVLVGFIFPALNLYSYGAIPVLIAVVAGILVFVMGGIFEWALAKWCGAVWWAGALGMLFVHWHYRGLVFIPLIAVGYIVPGLALRAEYKKSRAENAA